MQTIWDNIQHIAILFESDKAEGNTDIQEIILQLRKMGKTVTAWGYAPKHTIYTAAGTVFRILGKEDTTLSGQVRKPILEVWESIDCDLLLDLTLHDVRPLQQLAATSKAALKAGKERDSKVYQFMIHLEKKDEGRITLCKQIVHYLKTIQTQ